MRTILVGDCDPDRTYRLTDPDAPTEDEFTVAVVKALCCVYPNYHCVIFGGTFKHEGRSHRPDLALVAHDYSHWFIIEVELTTHSFVDHVLPQVRTFRYGDPDQDCINSLARSLNIPTANVEIFVAHVPSTVAVVANKRDSEWATGLSALDIQLVSVSVFKSQAGVFAVEVDGVLHAAREHLGFGTYSATDRSLRFPQTIRLPDGMVQFDDPAASIASWTITRTGEAAWATKDIGTADIPDGARVQILRSFDGRLILQRTWDADSPPRTRRYRPG